MCYFTEELSTKGHAPTGGGSGRGAGEELKTRYNNNSTTSYKIIAFSTEALAGLVAIPILIIMMPVVFIVAAFYGREVLS